MSEEKKEFYYVYTCPWILEYVCVYICVTDILIIIKYVSVESLRS